jgi:predicted XRE-type DNA-binding protein
MMTNYHIGSSLDEFLEEEGILGEVYAIAIKRVLVWQIEQAMQKQGLNKSQMAEAMGTSRTSLNRLLDPVNTSITLKTMERAAAIVGKRLHITLEDPQEQGSSMIGEHCI